MKYYVGIDLGGTNIVAGVVDEDYNIIAKASTKTNCPRPEKEIAADMDMKTNTVNQRISRGLKKLRKMLEEE